MASIHPVKPRSLSVLPWGPATLLSPFPTGQYQQQWQPSLTFNEHFLGAILSTLYGSSLLILPMRQIPLLSHLTDDKTFPESPPPFITLHWFPICGQSKLKPFDRLHKDLQVLTTAGRCSLCVCCLLPQAQSLLSCFLNLSAFAHTSPLPGMSSPSPHRLDSTTPGSRV